MAEECARKMRDAGWLPSLILCRWASPEYVARVLRSSFRLAPTWTLQRVHSPQDYKPFGNTQLAIAHIGAHLNKDRCIC